MTNAAPTFYMPKSPTGRMSHSKPAIQMLPSPGAAKWRKLLDENRKLQEQSSLAGKVFEVSRQQILHPGELVVWEPIEGKPGLWKVSHINYDRNPDFEAIEKQFARWGTSSKNPCAEIPLSDIQKCNLKARKWSIKPGYVRLKYVGGWAGYQGNGLPVVVKIEAIRPLDNEMVAIAVAAL